MLALGLDLYRVGYYCHRVSAGIGTLCSRVLGGYSGNVLSVAAMAAGIVDPSIAKGSIEAIAAIIVSVISSAAALASAFYANRQKTDDAKEDSRDRADQAEISAREQLYAGLSGDLFRLREDYNSLRADRTDLWRRLLEGQEHSARQDKALDDCERTSAALKSELLETKERLAACEKRLGITDGTSD